MGRRGASLTKKGEKAKEGSTHRESKLWRAKNRPIIVNSKSSTSSAESNKGPISKGTSKGHSKIAAKAGPLASTGMKRKVVDV